MRLARLLLVFPLLLALLLALAACGGDDAPSDEEYFRRMDEVDKETDADFENITCDENSTAQDCATGFGDAVASAETRYDDVTPSDEAKDEHEELVAAIGELNGNIEGAEFQPDDPPDAFFEIFDTARVDEAFCAIQDLADQKQIEADVGCEGGEQVDPATIDPVATTEVAIQDFTFDPPHIEAKVGDTVTWTQGTDGEPHTATATDDPPTFDTGTLTDEGETGEFTFTEAGEFPYYCEIHPEMLGLVTVTE
jgi:plastocyanin